MGQRNSTSSRYEPSEVIQPIASTAATATSRKYKPLLVAAIDFGTTFSGYTFLSSSDFQNEPSKIGMKLWDRKSSPVLPKVSTCILIEKDGQTVRAFGDEAESLYCQDPDRDSLYLFKRFKMMLDVKHNLNKRTQVKDVQGKCLPAIKVFSLSIRCLRKDLDNMIVKQIGFMPYMPSEIVWVLTVPAIWSDAAKQFMRDAAVEAGIPGDQLIIALEPEAAALYCRHLPPSHFVGEYEDVSSLPKGAQYMVVDAGGGTVDITIHEIVDSKTVKEVVPASGGPWGGVTVDEAYYQFLERITGPGFRAKLRAYAYEDDIEMVDTFESKKRNFKSDQVVGLRLPLISFDTICKAHYNEDFRSRLEKSSLGNTIAMTREWLKIPPDVFRDFFTDAIDMIANHIERLLMESNCKHIILVGGFSESPILQDAVKRVCPGRKVIIPPDAGLAIVKGAAIFGHDPSLISQRVSRFTYGISVSNDFDPKEHPISKQYFFENRCLCKDMFSPIVRAGETLKVGHPSKLKEFVPVDKKATKMAIEMFAVKGNEPKFVTDDGCQFVGKITVPMGESDNNKKVHVVVVLGGTEMQVECTYVETGKTTTGSINFLE